LPGNSPPRQRVRCEHVEQLQLASARPPYGNYTSRVLIVLWRAPMASKSFYDWLVAQKNQRTPLGEFARAVTRDPAFPKDVTITLDAVLEFIRASADPSPRALAIARTAYRTYARG